MHPKIAYRGTFFKNIWSKEKRREKEKDGVQKLRAKVGVPHPKPNKSAFRVGEGSETDFNSGTLRFRWESNSSQSCVSHGGLRRRVVTIVNSSVSQNKGWIQVNAKSGA